jgi:excisionase family DNA binding protein
MQTIDIASLSLSSRKAEPLAVSPAEAARLAGLGRTTIYAALGSGALKSLKIGKRRLIALDVRRSWLPSHEVAP